MLFTECVSKCYLKLTENQRKSERRILHLLALQARFVNYICGESLFVDTTLAENY